MLLLRLKLLKNILLKAKRMYMLYPGDAAGVSKFVVLVTARKHRTVLLVYKNLDTFTWCRKTSTDVNIHFDILPKTRQFIIALIFFTITYLLHIQGIVPISWKDYLLEFLQNIKNSLSINIHWPNCKEQAKIIMIRMTTTHQDWQNENYKT